MSTGSVINFGIVNNDILSIEADVIALKYAQSFHGADSAVAKALQHAGVSIDQLQLEVGDHILVKPQGAVRAAQVLFVGVPPLDNFGYQQIRQFSARTLEILALKSPLTRRLAMTIHGANLGLDEIECANEQLNGYLDALRRGYYPTHLQSISIVERDNYRAELLAEFFEQRFSNNHTPPNWIKQKDVWPIWTPFSSSDNRTVSGATRITSVDPGESSAIERKAHIFVAMPFAKEMRDIWMFGIYQTVRSAGLLCERIDEEVFTGDIIERMKKRIETADLVIADLTGGNPNVFLEVGYAWGKKRPTVLLCKQTNNKKKDKPLPFDVRGQRCLLYEDAADLQEKLTKELKGLELIK